MFNGYRQPSTDFQAVQNELQTLPFYMDVDLTTARSVAAGTALELKFTGNVLYIDQVTSTGSCRVVFQDNSFSGATPITAFPGFIARIPFTRLMIENDAQPGLRVRIVYGVDLDFTPAIGAGVFGNISVINGELSRTQANTAFMSFAQPVGAVGLQAHAQVWNAGAAKSIVLTNLWCYSNAGGNIFQIYAANGPLATFSRMMSTKRLGGASSAIAAIYIDSNAGLPSVIDNYGYVKEGSDSKLLPLTEPFVIRPGYGLNIRCTTANVPFFVTFQTFEIDA